jgi:shikimate dehydrogenase
VHEEVAKRLGVLGWPVAHSRSPAMHNAALASLAMDEWHYQLLPVPPQLLTETVRGLGDSGFVGANVTIPHKQTALALADSASAVAEAIGAANTLTFAADGAIAAENTDAPGLIGAIGEQLSGRSALVLGAGGSARAAVWALLDAGASEVSIYNRTRERADELARELGARSVARPGAAELLVNCTSVGLQAAGDELARLALTEAQVGEYPLVVDLVYRDGATALLSAARTHGSRTLDGLDVLVAQGALSFTLWTGRPAPLDVMRRAARRA